MISNQNIKVNYMSSVKWIFNGLLFFQIISCSPESNSNDSITNTENVVNRSKAVGEPPLMLAISVWLAIRDAVNNYRKDGIVRLNAPATPEEILKAINF